VRGARTWLLAVLLTGVVTGCTGSSGTTHSVPATKVAKGECVVPPKDPVAELSSVSVVPCTSRHTQEAYADVRFPGAKDVGYPGGDVLKKFADGACAGQYDDYVGVAYADSSLFFTYLLPSARGWQGGDRSVVCFVTTTGASMTRSVKGSKL
jgi:hypothetical protein